MIHFHKYIIQQSHEAKGSATDKLTGQVTENVLMTDILYKCYVCGKFKSETIRGNWSLKDLIG